MGCVVDGGLTFSVGVPLGYLCLATLGEGACMPRWKPCLASARPTEAAPVGVVIFLKSPLRLLLSLRRAPDETLISGSGGGGATVSCPSWRHRLGVHGVDDSQLHLFVISSKRHRQLPSHAYYLRLESTSSQSVWCCCSPLAPMYLALGECGSRVLCCGLYRIHLLVVIALCIKPGEILFW